ncbi:MAG: copper resistance protein CopC [Actinomycetota bacterium]|nr:copper resistance protein CopC [Actinomycetota bacterium]
MNRLRTFLLAASMLLGLVLAATPAFAHAAYKDSDPANGATVSRAPSSVTAEFTEPLAGGSWLKVFDPCGRQVDAGDVSIFGYEMSVSMSGVAAGPYVVQFTAYSRLDPHVTTGDFGFTATQGDECAGAETDSGSGAGSSTGSSTTGSGSNGASTTEGTEGDTTAASAGAAGSGDDDDTGTRSGASETRRDGFFDRGRQRAAVPNVVAAAEEPSDPEPSVWDGIRMDSFLTGLLLSAVIGAAGGKIYAGIMGPRA